MSNVHALERSLLEQIVARENLLRAWKRVKANKGEAGSADVSVADLPAWARAHWPRISRSCCKAVSNRMRYAASGYPKPMAISARWGFHVADRVIQQAIAQVIGPMFESRFSDYSFGFRSGRNAHQAVKRVREYFGLGFRHVVDIDLAAFFDSVNHDVLMRLVAQRVKDKRVLKLIGRSLRAGVEVDGVQQPTPLECHKADRYRRCSPTLCCTNWMCTWKARDAGSQAMPMTLSFAYAAHRRRSGESQRHPVPEPAFEAAHQSRQKPGCRQSPTGISGFLFPRNPDCLERQSLAPLQASREATTGRSWGVSMAYRYRELRRYVVGWLNYFALSEYTDRFPNSTNGYDGVCVPAIGNNGVGREPRLAISLHWASP